MEIKKAIIAVAGLGTRFYPASYVLPKELFPIVTIPVLQVIINELVEAGIDDILLIINESKTEICKHLNKCVWGDGKRINISYQIQKEQLGFADAISYGEKWTNKEDFVMLVGDEIFLAHTSSIRQMLETYRKFQKSIISLCEVPKNQTDKYGIAIPKNTEGNIIEITKIIEKPQKYVGSNIANIGKYIMNSSIFKYINELKNGKEGDFVSCLNELIKDNNLIGIKLIGERFDTGSKLGFIEANIAYGLVDKEIKDELLKFIKGRLYEI